MVQDTYTPLLSEVLRKVHNAKTKDKKIELLRQYDCEPLRMIIKSSFDPNIEWAIPEGEVPFKVNEAEEGTEHTVLRREARKLYRFIKGGDVSRVVDGDLFHHRISSAAVEREESSFLCVELLWAGRSVSRNSFLSGDVT